MTSTLTAERYSRLSIILHWLMALLFVGVYACVELHEAYPRGSDMRKLLMMGHFSLGISILLLVVIRIGARLRSSTPPIVPAIPQWQAFLSKLVHLFLYAMMIGMPLAGWLMMNGEGRAVPFFGFELPLLIGEDKAFAHTVEEVHETVGKLGYFVIGLHTLAAIVHHYVMKDNTVLRMLPARNG